MEGIITKAEELGARALLVGQKGKNIVEFGETSRTFNIASIRKTLLSALYGIRVAEGKINLSTSLAELGIDDNSPELTSEEKQATIRELLQLRSGIYHPANYETQATKDGRPQRGSHPHGTFWYYNNWDANALGEIYKKLIGTDIFKDFKNLIGDVIGMQDFDLQKCEYKEPDENSIFPAYIFRTSARDLLLFGQMYLQRGMWNGKQVVPEAWIEESTKPYSIQPNGNGFGYMWEVAVSGKLYGVAVGEGAFSYSGFPGHFLVIMPVMNKVLVYAHNVDFPEKKIVPSEKFAELLNMTVDL